MLKNNASQSTKDFLRSDKTMQELLNDNRLSCKAKGLFSYVYLTNIENFSIYDLVKSGPDSIDSVKSGVSELIKYKYFKSCDTKQQYVYLVTFDGIYYKIGKSDVLHHRFRSYETHSPLPLQVICTIKTDNMNKLESELLKMFKSKQVKSEWFRLDDCDIEYMKSLGGASND